MSQRRHECPSNCVLPDHRTKQAVETALDSVSRTLGLVGEHWDDRMDPAIGHTHMRSQINRVWQTGDNPDWYSVVSGA
jgi:hypothetical protein